jgi:hypothetical protein
MASTAYDSMNYDAMTGAIDFDTDSFKVMLVTSGYTEDKAAHSKRSSVTNEITGTGYTAGGQAIVPTITKDTTNHRTTIVFPQVTWPTSTLTARKAVYYKSRGGASSADELVAVDDFGSDVTTTAGTFTLNASTLHIGTPQ